MSNSEILFSEVEIQELQQELEKQTQTTKTLLKENMSLRAALEEMRENWKSRGQTIESLQEKNAMLSNSDLELKRAKELKESASQTLRNVEKERKGLEKKREELKKKSEELECWRQELGQERETIQNLKDEAHRKAAAILQKEDQIDDTIRRCVKEKTKEIRENAEKKIEEGFRKAKAEAEKQLAEEVKKLWRINSICTFSLTIYNIVLSVAWVIEQRSVIATIPEWFISRWESFLDFFNSFAIILEWIKLSVPESCPVFLRYALVILVCVVVFGFITLTIILVMVRMIELVQLIIEIYKNAGREQLIRKSQLSIVIILVSLVAAVRLVMLFEDPPLNVFSWWLLFSGVGLCIYHFVGIYRISLANKVKHVKNASGKRN